MASPTAIPHPETSSHHQHDPSSSSAAATAGPSSSSKQSLSSGFSPRSFNAPSAGLVSPLYRYARSASTSGGVAGQAKEYFDLSRSPSGATGGGAPTRPGPGPTSSARDQHQQQQQQDFAARSRSKSNSVSSTLSSASTADGAGEPITPGGSNSFGNSQQQQSGKSLSSVSFSGGFALGRVPSYPLTGSGGGGGSAGGFDAAQKRRSSGAMFSQANITGDATGGNGPGGGGGGAGGGNASATRHASTRSFSSTSAASSSSSPPLSTGMSNFDASSTGSSAGRGVTNLLRKLSIGQGQNLKSPSSANTITPPTFSGAAATQGQHGSGIAAPAPTPVGSMQPSSSSSGVVVPPSSAPAQYGGFRNLNNPPSSANAGAMNDSLLAHQQQTRTNGANGGAISANDLAAVGSAPSMGPPPKGRRGRQPSMSGEGTKRRPSPMGERLLMGHFAH